MNFGKILIDIHSFYYQFSFIFFLPSFIYGYINTRFGFFFHMLNHMSWTSELRIFQFSFGTHIYCALFINHSVFLDNIKQVDKLTIS